MNSRHRLYIPVLAAVCCLLASAAVGADVAGSGWFRLSDFSSSTSKDPLYVHCSYWNIGDPSDKVVKIRGVRDSRSGYFYPFVQLAVAPSKTGPWKPLRALIPRGSRFTLSIPGGINADCMPVEMTPFIGVLHAARWARISLPSGEAVLIDMAEVADVWRRHRNWRP
jgi:hypothetical protein